MGICKPRGGASGESRHLELGLPGPRIVGKKWNFGWFQESPTFLAPGTGFMEWGRLGGGRGLGTPGGHLVWCFYHGGSAWLIHQVSFLQWWRLLVSVAMSTWLTVMKILFDAFCYKFYNFSIYISVFLIIFKTFLLPWPGSSLGWSINPIHQGCGFDPRSGHVQKSTNECMNTGNNKSMFLSLSPLLFLN